MIFILPWYFLFLGLRHPETTISTRSQVHPPRPQTQWGISPPQTLSAAPQTSWPASQSPPRFSPSKYLNCGHSWTSIPTAAKVEMIAVQDPDFLLLFPSAVLHFHMYNHPSKKKKMSSPISHIDIVPFSELPEQLTCSTLTDRYLNNNLKILTSYTGLT